MTPCVATFVVAVCGASIAHGKETTMHTYEIITERILQKLEHGIVPWHKPWEQGIPRNLVTHKPYRGINVFLTANAGFTLPYWLTLKQANAQDGTIRKGEKGTPVIFWKWLHRFATTADATDDTDDTTAKHIPLLRYYTVFNLEQCTGIDAPAMTREAAFTPIEICEKLVGNMPQRPTITHGTPKAYYRPLSDCINMPHAKLFDTSEAYYSTLFHELTHSTGHESRLNRHNEQGANCQFDSPEYSKEELIAEMGAAFLCGICNIENHTVDNSAAYIASWLRVLNSDKQLVILAAAQAQRAADFIQGVSYQD
jgi:antirestriction protein ArdC